MLKHSFKLSFTSLLMTTLIGCAANQIDPPIIPHDISPEGALALVSDTPLAKTQYSTEFAVYQGSNPRLRSWDKSLTQQYVDYCVNADYRVTSVTADDGAYIRCRNEQRDFAFVFVKENYRIHPNLYVTGKDASTDYLDALRTFAKKINAESPLTDNENKLLAFKEEHMAMQAEYQQQQKRAANAQNVMNNAVVGTYLCLEQGNTIYRGAVEQIAGQKYKMYVDQAYLYGQQMNKNPEFVWITPSRDSWYICD